MRTLRLNGGLNDLSKIIKALSSGARTSINSMFNGFSTLLMVSYDGWVYFSERGFPRNLVARSGLLIVYCNTILSREEGSVFVKPLYAWNPVALVG